MKGGGGGGGGGGGALAQKEGEEEEEDFTLGIFTSRYPLFHVAFTKKERKTWTFSKEKCTRTTEGAVRYLARVVNP